MGKKFGRAVVSVVAIVVGFVIGGPYGSALGAALVNIGVSALASIAISAFGSARRQSAPPINVTLRGTIQYRRLVFGRRRAGGVLVFYGCRASDSRYAAELE
jgi:hypothetical protein